MYTPFEITKDEETGVETASFDYYTGIAFVKEKGLKQSTEFSEMRKGTHFVVCCGDVMIHAEPTDWPEIERRIF